MIYRSANKEEYFDLYINWVFLILSILLLSAGCGLKTSDASNRKDSLVIEHGIAIEQHNTNRIDANNPKSMADLSWTDSLLEYYINHSNSPLIKQSLQNEISEEWLFDQVINMDSAKYFVFQIGHDESDKGNANKRFVTDQWIYIDSLTKCLYEYDLVNDSLSRWTK